MEISEVLEFDDKENILACHGSPFSNRDKLLPEDEITKNLIKYCDENIILCGHTHKQRSMQYGDKIIYNPGAVGVPTYSNGEAQFAVLKYDDNKWKVDFVSIKYDVEAVVKAQLEAGLDKKAPYWWKVTNHLLHGSLYSLGDIMRKIMDKANELNGECNWPDISEDIWKATYEEIFGAEELIGRDVFDDKREENYPICLETKLIHESRWMSLYCDKVEMPSGFVIDTYYKVHIPNESIALVIVNDDGKILLIESKRYTTSRLEWEIPAGAIEPGECSEQAARRECMEETGCKIASMQYMYCNHPCNGLNDVLLHFYLAKVTSESNDYDVNEVSQKRWVSKDEILKMLKNNETNSGISAYGLLHAINFYL